MKSLKISISYLTKLKVKNLLTLCGVITLLLLTNIGHTQNESYLQGWKMIGESETYMDVSVAVTQCSMDGAKILVSLHNEGLGPQTPNLTINISDPTSGNSFSHDIVGSEMPVGQMFQPECGSSENQDLKILVPSGYDPATINVSVTFN